MNKVLCVICDSYFDPEENTLAEDVCDECMDNHEWCVLNNVYVCDGCNECRDGEEDENE